jgi:hypothetical protein
MIIPTTETMNCYPSKQINRGKYLYNLQVVHRRDTLQNSCCRQYSVLYYLIMVLVSYISIMYFEFGIPDKSE